MNIALAEQPHDSLGVDEIFKMAINCHQSEYFAQAEELYLSALQIDPKHPDTNYNLKIRRNQPLYKPIMMKTRQAIAYGKKINLEEQVSAKNLPGADEADRDHPARNHLRAGKVCGADASGHRRADQPSSRALS